MKARYLVEGDEIHSPSQDRWFTVRRTVERFKGRKVGVLTEDGKTFTVGADAEFEVRRGECGRAIDLAGLGEQGVIVSGSD